MKKEINYQRRMYCGYPVFVVCFWDDACDSHNISVLSSSYVLGRMITIGTLSSNTFASSLNKSHKFSVNLIAHDKIDQVLAGATGKTAERRLRKSGLHLDIMDDNIALIDEAQISYCCTLNNIFIADDFPKYAGVIAHIDKVYVDQELYDDGNIRVEYYNPSIFIGTDQGRYIRTIDHKQE